MRPLLIFSLYLAISLIYFGRGLPGHFGDYYVGRETDPGVHMWFFSWWRFSLSHGLNPFLTDWVWAPLGINLAWTTCVPLPSLISIPLQVTVGEPATYNIIAMLMLPLAAFSAFLLCRRVTGAFWPSVLGGYIFGFSSYMLGEVLAHLDLVAVFPVPFIVLLTLKKLDAEISARRYAILTAALLTVQFLCFPELFATITIVGGFALLLAMVLFDSGGMRVQLAGLIGPAASGYLIASAFLSPYLYFMLSRGFPHAPIWKPGITSADLLAFLVPTETVMLGTARAATEITRTFQGDICENGAYLGIAIILFVEVLSAALLARAGGKISDAPVRHSGDRGDGSIAPCRGPARVLDAMGDYRPAAADFGRAAGTVHVVCLPGPGRNDGDVVRSAGRATADEMDRRRGNLVISRAESARIVLGKQARHPRILHRPNLRY